MCWCVHCGGRLTQWLQFVAQRLLATGTVPDDGGAEDEAYASLVAVEELAHRAIEHALRHVPAGSVTTRSKRRSIQRAQDAWKVLPEAGTPPASSAWDLVVAAAPA